MLSVRHKIIRSIKSIILKILNKDLKICRDLNAHIKSNASKAYIITHYSNAKQYVYPSPRSIQGNVVSFLSVQNQFGTFDRYLAVLHNARLHTQEGYIQLTNNEIVLETAWAQQNIKNDTYFNKLFKPKEEFKSGKWFSSLLFWSWGYYHWLCDVLPRFYLVLNDLPLDTKIIIPHNARSWQIRSLELIGISRERMVEFPLDRIWKFEELYFAPPVAMTGDHLHEATQWVSQTMIENLGIHGVPDNNKRIYISRGQAATRRIVNEPSLVEYLKKNDFEIVINEELTFDDQIRLFYSASHIVAPHGAGLSNLLFSQAGKQVLEIFEKGTLRRCYWTLANTKNIDYTCYVGNSVGIDIPGEADIEIDLHVFETYFEGWLTKNLNI
jgi:hypothetical protein